MTSAAQAPSGQQTPASHVTAEGHWHRHLAKPYSEPVPALYLDRDGVMIEDRHYLSDPGDVRLIAGCAAAIRTARDLGYAVVVVSNQSGVGRGLFGWCEHAAVEDRMLALLAEQGVSIDASLACAAHPAGRDSYALDHHWRKPNPGMLLAAAAALNVQLAGSLIVGDKASDLAAGAAAGLGYGLHVVTGQGHEERAVARTLSTQTFKVALVESIACVASRQADHWHHRRGQQLSR